MKDKYKPTKSMGNNAKRGKEYRERNGGKGGTSVGLGMATKLINGTELTQEEVNKMHSFFSRHDGNQKVPEGKEPYEDAGYVAWLLWGGDSGKSWASERASSNKEGSDDPCWDGYERVPGTKKYEPGSCRKVGGRISYYDDMQHFGQMDYDQVQHGDRVVFLTETDGVEPGQHGTIVRADANRGVFIVEAKGMQRSADGSEVYGRKRVPVTADRIALKMSSDDPRCH